MLVRDVFAQRGVGGYLAKLMASPAVRGCYEELFLVSVLLTQQRSWVSIAREYGIRDAPGCLNELAEAIVRKHAAREPLEAYREIARSMVQDVLLSGVREDDDVFFDGRAVTVFARIDPRVFQSLSGHALGALLYRAAQRELPALDRQESTRLREATQERADYLIAMFARRFYAKNQTTHRQLLQVFQEHEDWFLDKLWEPVPA